ncbi:hypothetical protein M9458_041817, partial [Cirrhinus mrigala]
MPVLPPALASSSSSIVVCQPLCSPSAHYLCGGLTVGLQVSIGVTAGGPPVSASSLRVQDSASACQPSGSTMAPSSLLSTVARQSTGSTGLPPSSGSVSGSSATVARPPGVVSPFSSMAPPSVSST